MSGSIKGTRYMAIRKMVRGRGSAFEKRFLEKLAPVERERYEKMTPVAWIPVHEIPEQGDVVTVAAEMFFPGDAQGVQKVAAGIAKENLQGIYQFLLQDRSLDSAVKRGGMIWRTYNDTGEASFFRVSEYCLDLNVREYPDMTALHRIYVQGFLCGMLEMAGIREYTVTLDESNPENWKWRIIWK